MSCKASQWSTWYPHGMILTHRVDNNDSQLCDLSSATGCLRCKPKTPPDSCCDLCFPHSFIENTMDNITNTRPARTGTSRIKAFESGDCHRDLRTALLSWREQAALQKHGKMVVRRYGSQILMSERILDRLIVCAQARKISTNECLKRETHWKPDLADTYGAAVISILHDHFPLVLASSSKRPAVSETTLDNNVVTVGAVNEESKKITKPRTCSACGQQGHIRMYTAFYISLICSILLCRFKSIVSSSTVPSNNLNRVCILPTRSLVFYRH